MRDLKLEHFKGSNLRPIRADDGTTARNMMIVLGSIERERTRHEKPAGYKPTKYDLIHTEEN